MWQVLNQSTSKGCIDLSASLTSCFVYGQKSTLPEIVICLPFFCWYLFDSFSVIEFYCMWWPNNLYTFLCPLSRSPNIHVSLVTVYRLKLLKLTLCKSSCIHLKFVVIMAVISIVVLWVAIIKFSLSQCTKYVLMCMFVWNVAVLCCRLQMLLKGLLRK